MILPTIHVELYCVPLRGHIRGYLDILHVEIPYMVCVERYLAHLIVCGCSNRYLWQYGELSTVQYAYY